MIKSLVLIICAVIFSTSTLYAGPASPDVIEITQPDGTTFTSRIHGDEFQNWTVSESTGHTILHNKTSGYWEYAEQNRDGTLRPGGIKVRHSGAGASPSLPKGLRPPRNRMHERHMKQSLNDINQQSLASPAMDASTNLSGAVTAEAASAQSSGGNWAPVPVSGSRKALVILISFADRVIQTSPTNWYTSVFEESSKSVAKYYKDNSFGLLSVSPASHTQSGNPAGVVSVAIIDNHPDYGGNYVYETETNILNHALAQAATYVNFASFDVNGNGRLDQSELTVYFIYAGYEASGSSRHPNVWAHSWSGAISAASKTISSWAQSGELNDSIAQHPMGVIAHELGHALCGLPDLYDVSGTNQAMGVFSLMSVGSWGKDSSVDTYSGMTPTSLDAWSREFLGWSTPVQPVWDGTMSLDHVLASQDSVYKLMVPTTSTTEYFLVEHRRPFSWDAGLKRWLGSSWLGGLLVLHIDNTAGSASNNDINDYSANSISPGHQGVVPVQASSSCNMLAVGATCAGNASTLFYSGNNNNWTAATTPNSNYYNGTSSGFSLTGISAPVSTMTGSLQVPPRMPDVTTGVATNITATGATLKGVVSSNNAVTSVSFEYGTTSGYGGNVSGGSLSALAVSTAVTVNISGLSCNTSYHYRVNAVNSAGTTHGSDAVFSTTACVPGPPTITSVVAGNKQAAVYYSPPDYDGGSPVSSYMVTPSTGTPVISSTFPITVSDLENGKVYTLTIKAINVAGAGLSSSESSVVTPGTVVVNSFDSVGYQNIQDAYNADSSGNGIKVLAGESVGQLLVNPMNAKTSVLVSGGYDDSFNSSSGPPSILTSVSLSAGTTRFQNIVIKGP